MSAITKGINPVFSFAPLSDFIICCIIYKVEKLPFDYSIDIPGGEIAGIGFVNVLWFVLTLAFVISFIFSLILFYHWNRYGIGKIAVWSTEVIYIFGIIFLVLGALASLLLF